jgi:hypothetical protein
MSPEEKRNGCLGIMAWMFILLVAGFVLIAMGSCRSVRYVPIETIKHDSVYITQHQKDSIYIHDSIYQKENGDTVLIEKWHTRYIEKQVRDTLIQIQSDTIPQPYPYEVEVPAQLSWWQKTRMHIGEITIIALLVLLGSWIVRIKW